MSRNLIIPLFNVRLLASSERRLYSNASCLRPRRSPPLSSPRVASPPRAPYGGSPDSIHGVPRTGCRAETLQDHRRQPPLHTSSAWPGPLSFPPLSARRQPTQGAVWRVSGFDPWRPTHWLSCGDSSRPPSPAPSPHVISLARPSLLPSPLRASPAHPGRRMAGLRALSMEPYALVAARRPLKTFAASRPPSLAQPGSRPPISTRCCPRHRPLSHR